MPKLVHLHKSQKYDKYNIFLLLIPILIFGIVLATYIFSKTISTNSESLTTTSNHSFVLGGSDNNLDNTKANLIK